jgi:hypothetical protein
MELISERGISIDHIKDNCKTVGDVIKLEKELYGQKCPDALLSESKLFKVNVDYAEPSLSSLLKEVDL